MKLWKVWTQESLGGRGAHITTDMCFPGRETHTTRHTCFSGGGTNFTRDTCFLGRGTYITRDMCFPGGGTHILRDMCYPGREHISLGICVSKVGERISVEICVSQVTGGKNLKVPGDSAGCRRILTTLITQRMERTFRNSTNDNKFDVSALLLVKVPFSSTLVRGHLPKTTTN